MWCDAWLGGKLKPKLNGRELEDVEGEGEGEGEGEEDGVETATSIIHMAVIKICTWCVIVRKLQEQ